MTYNIKDLLKQGDYEKYNLTDEMIIELIGFDKICDDYVDDMQHYIDNAYFEMKALMAEA